MHIGSFHTSYLFDGQGSQLTCANGGNLCRDETKNLIHRHGLDGTGGHCLNLRGGECLNLLRGQPRDLGALDRRNLAGAQAGDIGRGDGFQLLCQQ